MAGLRREPPPTSVGNHSVYADPDLAVFLNADPDPALQKLLGALNYVKQTYEEFAEIVPHQRQQFNRFFLNTIKIQLLTISMHFLGGPLYELKTAHTQ